MNKSKRTKVLSILLIVAIIWGYFNLKPSPIEMPEDSKVEKTEAKVPEVKIPPSQHLINIEEKEKESWGMDPFQTKKIKKPVINKINPNKLWRLSGIIFNNHSPVAIINNKPIKIGEKVDNAKVIKIEKKAVTLEYNGKQMVIKVAKG